MDNISNLPRDMLEEILCRIPVTSTRAVKSTCKKWNNIFKDGSFTKKHLLTQEASSREDGEFMAITLINFEISLMRIDLGGIYNNESDEPPQFLKPKDCWIEITCRGGVSLKGNTSWYGMKEYTGEDSLAADRSGFLVCFDFTTEVFGPHLPLPFVSSIVDSVILSSVREEQQLAVLFNRRDDNMEMGIWFTTNIEPDVVSWSKFFAIDMKPLTGFLFSTGASFIIDEEKRVVIVFDKDLSMSPFRNIVCIIEENGYFKKIDIGKQTSGNRPVVCSYFPNCVQINQPA